jgi:hypothetical protein
MKPIATMLVWAMIMGASLSAKAEEAEYVKRTYMVSATHSEPLGTYQRCNENSKAGYAAFAQALSEAFLQCRSEDNIDCISEGARYRASSSTEFPGYRLCTATVVVRGYSAKVSN